MTIGERLREERERLGLSQPRFAAVAATTKQTLFSWENGKTAPDGFQLAALAELGVDVLYVLTGERARPLPASAGLPRDQMALLNSYEICSEAAKKTLLQTAALLAAGVHTAAPGAAPGARAPGNSQVGNDNVWVGSSGGKVSIKKGK